LKEATRAARSILNGVGQAARRVDHSSRVER
jgi:hypothetical protein